MTRAEVEALITDAYNSIENAQELLKEIAKPLRDALRSLEKIPEDLEGVE